MPLFRLLIPAGVALYRTQQVRGALPRHRPGGFQLEPAVETAAELVHLAAAPHEIDRMSRRRQLFKETAQILLKLPGIE